MGTYNGYGYGYDEFGGMFGDSDVMAVVGMFLGFILVFIIIAWAFALVMYILQSVGLYRISENRGMSGSALAWIPMIGFYRIGAIADDIVARNGGKSYYKYILLIGGIVNIFGGSASWFFSVMSNPIFSSFVDGYHGSPYGYGNSYNGYYDEVLSYWGVSMLVSAISIALFVFTLVALNKVYKCYRPMSSTAWTVISVIFPFMQSIFLFMIRNAVPVPAWSPQGYYPMQNPMPNQNWQAPPPPPPPYMPYGQQPPVNGGYPMQNQGWQAPPPQQGAAYPPPPPPPQGVQYQPPFAPPQEASYQPPVAPNPPEPWEIKDTSVEQPPRAPWEHNNGNS